MSTDVFRDEQDKWMVLCALRLLEQRGPLAEDELETRLRPYALCFGASLPLTPALRRLAQQGYIHANCDAQPPRYAVTRRGQGLINVLCMRLMPTLDVTLTCEFALMLTLIGSQSGSQPELCGQACADGAHGRESLGGDAA